MISSRAQTPSLPSRTKSSGTISVTTDRPELSKQKDLSKSASEDAEKSTVKLPPDPKSNRASRKAQLDSFASRSMLKRSPKLQQALDRRASTETGKLPRDDSGAGLPSKKSPKLQQLFDRRTASAGSTPGPKSSSGSSLSKASKIQQLFDRRPSLKQAEDSPRHRVHQRSASESSPSQDPFVDRKVLVTVSGITAPGGAATKRPYLTSARRERAAAQLSVDLTPKFSLLNVSSKTPAPSITPTPHRSSRLSVSFDSLPGSPPPNRPPPNPPSSSPEVPNRSPSRLLTSNLKPLLIPPSKQPNLTITISNENQGTLSPAQTPKSSKTDLSSESAHLPQEKSIPFLPPPSPPHTSSPVSANSLASSISSHSTHSITSITENLDSLLNSPSDTSPDVEYRSFTARQVTLSRPKVTLTDSQPLDKDMSEVGNLIGHKLLKRIREEVIMEGSDKTVVNLTSDDDPFTTSAKSAELQLGKPAARKMKIESVEAPSRAKAPLPAKFGASANPTNKMEAESVPQSVAASPDVKKGPLEKHHAALRTGNDAVETVKEKIRLREGRLQQKLRMEEKQKNALAAELQAIKEEAKEINKRKKEKEAEIEQIDKKIADTNGDIDELEQAIETLTGVKRLLK